MHLILKWNTRYMYIILKSWKINFYTKILKCFYGNCFFNLLKNYSSGAPQMHFLWIIFSSQYFDAPLSINFLLQWAKLFGIINKRFNLVRLDKNVYLKCIFKYYKYKIIILGILWLFYIYLTFNLRLVTLLFKISKVTINNVLNKNKIANKMKIVLCFITMTTEIHISKYMRQYLRNCIS